VTSRGTLRSVLNPSNRIRIPLLPLGKQLDHDQPRNKSAAEGLAIFGLAAIFITQIVAICVLARTFKRGHVLRGLFSVLSIICSLLLISIMVFSFGSYLGLFDSCRKQAIALTTWSGWVRILGGSRRSPDNPLQLNAGFAILRTADLECWRDQGLRSLRRQCVQPAWRHPHYVNRHNAIRQCSWERAAGAQG